MVENVEVTRLVVPSNMSPVTSVLVEVMKHGKPGDVKTLAELGPVVSPYAPEGKTLENGLGGNLRSAAQHCERIYRCAWYRRKDENDQPIMRCLTNEEKIEEAQKRSGRARRNSNRAIRVLGTVETSDMSDVQRTEFNTQCALHGTLAMFASGRAIKAMAARKVTKALDMTELLDAMK